MDILGKEKDTVIAEVQKERYPPNICYKVLYTSAAEQRQTPTFWRAELIGADVNLFFNCRVTQEQGTYTHVLHSILCEQTL